MIVGCYPLLEQPIIVLGVAIYAAPFLLGKIGLYMNDYECEGQINLFDYMSEMVKVCSFSGHTCNKKNLWEVADTLDDLQCPHVCCRKCNTRLCGARCNGSEEPKEPVDDYIKEHPTCFYVFGYYLNREHGWHKIPEELPNFNTWHLVDVVLFGKKTNTSCMEHEKWEAKDWTFRSVDERRSTETLEILAWKLSDKEAL